MPRQPSEPEKMRSKIIMSIMSVPPHPQPLLQLLSHELHPLLHAHELLPSRRIIMRIHIIQLLSSPNPNILRSFSGILLLHKIRQYPAGRYLRGRFPNKTELLVGHIVLFIFRLLIHNMRLKADALPKMYGDDSAWFVRNCY